MQVVYSFDDKQGVNFGTVRKNLMHRGNARLQLEEMEDGKYPYIQFERTPDNFSQIREDDFFRGYYCIGNVAKPISFYIKNN